MIAAKTTKGRRAQDIGRSAGLGRHRLDLEAHVPAAAQDVGEVGQGFGEIAAGLALDRQCHHEELEFRRVETLGRLPQRLFQRQAEADGIGDGAELDADRIGHFDADGADQFTDRQAGFEAAHDQVDGFREQRREFAQAARHQEAHRHMRQPRADGNTDQARDQRRQAHEHVDDERDRAHQHQHEQNVFAQVDALAGRGEAGAHLFGLGQGPLDQPINAGHAAVAAVAAHQRDRGGTGLGAAGPAFAQGVGALARAPVAAHAGKGQRAQCQHRGGGHRGP